LNTVLNELTESKNNHNPLQLHEQDETFFIFKLAQKKSTIITQNFKNVSIDNEPYVFVVFNNDQYVQKIAISENIDAFSNPDVVKNIVSKLLKKDLKKYQLNIAIESMFDSVNFWDYVEKHNDQITYVNFKYIKPNMASISKSLPKDFQKFTNNVNSHESHIVLKAPENGVLENIDKQNQNINGLVDYTSEGAGSIKLKVKGVRKYLNTKEVPLILEIDEVSLEGASEQVIKMYKGLVE
jgi:hypothetical protein